MKYRMFTYSIGDDGELPELNAFLSSHRILDVRHHEADDGRRVVFVVEYVDSGRSDRKEGGKPPRIDYREVLSEGGFAVFAQLRDLRKAVAEEEGVQVYNVFTNAQLAAFAQMASPSQVEMGKVAGVGQARLEKYGERVLSALRDLGGGAG